MTKQTNFTQQRLLERQSAQYVNDSELPFTMPRTPPGVDADLLVDARAARRVHPARDSRARFRASSASLSGQA